MQKNIEGKFKSLTLSTFKYLFAMMLFGAMVLMVIVTYTAVR